MTGMKVSGERIYQARLAADMSRADLATAVRRVSDVKATERSVARWEKEEGGIQPSAIALASIADATGKPLDFFYVGRDSFGADAPVSREAAIYAALRPLAQALATAEPSSTPMRTAAA
jgi:transcriptional regulator with XRE-family HTH domain